ncbi:DUF2860 domain-containing protein [Vibrio crassostreae]|uniref:DUF2860 domain-containing protein n=2 Tax=Vibrio crassostreae TaxID=246167 RepID=A0A822MUK1_9VIBR|nr:DUF2860 domain-containing protein [Vibrio crassostreae]MDH5948794.1 DUF2860 domain-containing protein [Vibrio crassostreae]ROO54240.1 uncharacterized protein DUF2860 [Vibrio crassostreae]ROO65283.1 uncharacterized protein DUF2860 [Vibrio crassostreae]ROO69288.1 uncharacterized protein DUF2860 [Vibrio crassostreae]ROO70853.1 uncharacterized protein DUF2860 [Vibrio crassostreae]
MRFVLPVVISAFASMPAYSGLAPNEGFSGNFSVLAGFYSDSSNLSTEQDSNQATNTEEGNSEKQGLLGFLGTVQYTFGESLTHQVYAGTTREDIATGTIAFEIGYRHQLLGGTILDFSVLPTLISGKAWSDPYAVGVNRNETDVKGNVGRLQLTNIGGTAFQTDFAIGESDVDDELSGTQSLSAQDAALLDRERTYVYAKAGYRFILPNQTGLLVPSMVYFHADAEGDALSFDSYGIELNYAKRIGRHGFVVTLDASDRQYDEANPIYGKTREENEYGAFLAYEFGGLMGYEDWSFITLLGLRSIDSNIDFYNSEQVLASVGVDYKF